MKRITYFFIAFIMIAFQLHSQSELEALKYSKNELHGTARSIAMGGAFGALGGDLTGVSINPAGIGVYRSSEIAGTFGFQNNISQVGDLKKNISDFNVHNFGFVGYFPIRNESMPMINFGFAHNRQKNFNRNIGAMGDVGNGSTMIDYIANDSYGVNKDGLLFDENDKNVDPFFTHPWLTVLGYNAGLIYAGDDNKYIPLDTKGANAFQEIRSSERGYIDNYDFTIGTSINDVLNIGLSLSIYDVYHRLSSEFLEDYDTGTNNYQNAGYTIGNNIITSGSGIGAKLGVIYRPIHELRLGLAYHTPTIYSLTETYEAFVDHNLSELIKDEGYKAKALYSPVYNNYYDLRTPSKWVLSAASVLGSNFILSADYELTDYRNMKLKVPSDFTNTNAFDYDNEYIEQDFKMSSTIRLGAEYRFTQQLSARLGYAWMQNPYDNDFKDYGGNPGIAGSNTIFRMKGDTNYYTGGIGYRFTRAFYMDMALVYQTQNDHLYPFPNRYNEIGDVVIDAFPFEMKTKSFRGVLTMGYKF